MSLLCKKKVREYALFVSVSTGRKFTMIHKDFYQKIERKLVEIIRQEVHSACGGKMLK